MKRSLPMLLTIALAGCGGTADAGSSMDTIVRDSAGVTIVENRAPEGAPVAPIRLSPAPVLQIGTLDGPVEYQLHRVQHIARLSDGTIVIANGGSSEIRFYDEAGVFRTAAGRAGEGPGEFQVLSTMRRLHGDTIMVYDARSRRVTLVGPEGESVRDFTPVAAEDATPLNVAGALADGTMLFRERALGLEGGGLPPSGFTRDTTTFAVAAQGGPASTLQRVPAAERMINVSSSGGQIVSIQIMGVPYARAALSAAGSNHLFIGSNELYRIDRYDASGRLVTSIRSDHVPTRPVTADFVRRHADNLIAQRSRDIETTAADDAAFRETIEDLPRVPTVPVFGTMLADASDRLWVREYAMPGADELPSLWTLFASDGRMEGVVEMPPGFRPYHIDEEVVIGVVRDDFDVEYVQVWRLEAR